MLLECSLLDTGLWCYRALGWLDNSFVVRTVNPVPGRVRRLSLHCCLSVPQSHFNAGSSLRRQFWNRRLPTHHRHPRLRTRHPEAVCKTKANHPKTILPRRALVGRRSSARLMRNACLETLRAHRLGTPSCKPLAGNTSGRRWRPSTSCCCRIVSGRPQGLLKLLCPQWQSVVEGEYAQSSWTNPQKAEGCGRRRVLESATMDIHGGGFHISRCCVPISGRS